MEKNKHTVYMLRCGDGTLYTGYTNHLSHRLQMHRTGKGAKYTRGRGPLTLVYEEFFSNKSDAMVREYEIKQYHRDKKCELIKQYEQKRGKDQDANTEEF